MHFCGIRKKKMHPFVFLSKMYNLCVPVMVEKVCADALVFVEFGCRAPVCHASVCCMNGFDSEGK